VEKAPVVIKEGVKKEELDAIKKILTDAGAVIEIL
jgi:ribosomal protein L7/L12